MPQDFVWPAARQVVDRYAIDRPVAKTPAVRSTYTSRVRAGEAVRRGCTPGQVRALASAVYRGLAAGEAGEKARQWEQRLRMHRDSTGMDAPIAGSLRGTMGPPARRSTQRPASAPAQPQHTRPQYGEMRIGAAIDEAGEELDGTPWPSAAMGAGGWEAPELAETADGPPVPAPPAAIAFAWQHPTKLLQNIGNGKAAWGPDKQACLEAYLKEVATPTPTPAPTPAPPSQTLPADAGASSPAAAAAAAAPRSPRHARPASAPVRPATHAERVYRAAPSTSRPGSGGGGANATRPPWHPPSPPQQDVEPTTAPQPQDEVNVLRRRPPPPLPSRPATAPPRPARQQQQPPRPRSANSNANASGGNAGWVDRLSGCNTTAHDRRRRLAARVLAHEVQMDMEERGETSDVAADVDADAEAEAEAEAEAASAGRLLAEYVNGGGRAAGQRWDEPEGFNALRASLLSRVHEGHALLDEEIALLRSMCNVEATSGGAVLSHDELRELQAATQAWRAHGMRALQEGRAVGRDAEEALRRERSASARKQRQKEAARMERVRLHNEARLAEHAEAMATWRRQQRNAAKLEKWHAELHAEIEAAPANPQTSRRAWSPASSHPSRALQKQNAPPHAAPSLGASNRAGGAAQQRAPSHRPPPPPPVLLKS